MQRLFMKKWVTKNNWIKQFSRFKNLSHEESYKLKNLICGSQTSAFFI